MSIGKPALRLYQSINNNPSDQEKSTSFDKITHLPEIFFLIAALIAGIASLFITPPFQVSEEYEHFFRAYNISRGILSTENTTVPDSIIDLADSFPKSYLTFNIKNKQNIYSTLSQFSKSYTENNFKSVNINNTTYYTPLPYLPQTVGILTGRLLKLAPISIFYLSRLFNLITWIALTLLAIQIAPFQKWVLVLIACMPMTIYQAASVSADGLTIALAFLFIAYFLSLLRRDQKVITLREKVILLILLLLVSLTKQVYGLLAFTIVFIPPSRFGGMKKYLPTVIPILLSLALVIFAWYSYVSIRFIPNNPGANPSAQLLSIFDHPDNYILILLRSIYKYSFVWIVAFIGAVGWNEISLQYWIVIPYFFLLPVVALGDGSDEFHLARWSRVGMALIMVGLALSIITSMFLYWTHFGEEIVEGVQGRYFIPFAWLFYLSLYNRRFASGKPFAIALTILIVFLAQLELIHTIILRYYIS